MDKLYRFLGLHRSIIHPKFTKRASHRHQRRKWTIFLNTLGYVTEEENLDFSW